MNENTHHASRWQPQVAPHHVSRITYHVSRITPVLILLLAFCLRVIGLETAPPGPRFDEILVFMEADRIEAGEWRLYSADIDEEMLFHYTLAGATNLVGRRLITGRWLAGAFDMLALATLYPLAQRIGGRRTGLLAMALMAVGFWPVLYSRFAQRMTSLLPFLTAAVYLFWRGLERPAGQERRAGLDLALAGISLGISVHAYAFGRAAPALFLSSAAYLLVAHRATLRKYALPIGLAILIPALVDAHLLFHLRAHPGVAHRLGQVSSPLEALSEGDLGPILEYVWRGLTMAVWKGDPEWLYNLSERPVFDPVTGALFYLGLFLCVAGWRRRWYGALLIWMVAGLAPTVLTWPPASFSHGIAAQPVFYLLAALGADYALDKLARIKALRLATAGTVGDRPEQGLAWISQSRPSEMGRLATAGTVGDRPEQGSEMGKEGARHFGKCPAPGATVVVAVVLVVANLLLTGRDYFGAWTVHPNVRAEYQASLTDLARYLESHDLPPVVAGGTLVDVWNPSNAYGFGLIYRRPDHPVAWYNPSNALAWPPGPGPMIVALPHIDRPVPPLAPELADLFFDGAQLVHEEKLPDGQPVFELYQAGGRQALDERLAVLGAQLATTPDGSQPVSLPANVDSYFKLLGYEAPPGQLKPGQQFSVITYWEAQRSFLDHLIAFTHLVGPDGKLYAQADQVGVYIDTFYPGLAFVQLHRLEVPADAPAGNYYIQAGMYWQGNFSRLPILADGRPVAEAALRLSEVRVEH